MKRLLVCTITFVALGCEPFDRLVADALDAGVKGGGGSAGGGTAGGTTAGGTTAGGTTAGGTTAGGTTAGGTTAGGTTAGGTTAGGTTAGGTTAGGSGGGCTPPTNGGSVGGTFHDAGVLCACNPDAGSCCMGSCEIRTLHPGVNANTSVVSALSAGGQIFGATETGDGGSLAVFSMGLLPMGTPVPYVGALRDLDGRFGRAIAVTDREVFLFNGTSWSVLPNPPELVSCFAGATYNAGAGIEHVAVCDTDGGLRAYSVTVASGFGASVSVPTTVTGLSEVRVRPDGAGLFGRYLLRGSSSAWDFRTFQQNQTNVVGSTGFNAQHAFLATSNDQTCVAAVEESPGIRVWRPSAQPNSFNYPSSIPYAVEGTTNTNLRGLVTVGSGIDVYVLERSGAATPLRMRGFELPAELNEWLLVVDRPGRIIEYRLGAGIRRVVATALTEAELVVAVRCTTQTGTSLCQATPGTYVVRLPLE